jgi:hypothetical protein
VLAVDGGRESILSVWQWQWGHLLGKVAVSSNSSSISPTVLPNSFIYNLHKHHVRAVSRIMS